MATIKVAGSVVGQIEAGTSILAAATTVKTAVIQTRLKAFEAAQRELISAHEKVQAAGSRLGDAQMRLGERDTDQNVAVDALARALVVDGRPRSNPFRDLSPLAPSRIVKLPADQEAQAVHALVAAVRRIRGVSKPTLAAAQAADKAASAVEQTQTEVEKLQAALRPVRDTRSAVAQRWANQFAALKRAARAAADDGAPHVYPALFDRPSRSRPKTTKPAPSQAPAPTPAPVATA